MQDPSEVNGQAPVRPDPKHGSSRGGKKLLWALIKLSKGGLILTAIPRILMMVITYSQPIFIKKTIAYVTDPGLSKEGHSLIIAAFVIYFGMGVSYSICQTPSARSDTYQHYRYRSVYTTKVITRSRFRLVGPSLVLSTRAV